MTDDLHKRAEDVQERIREWWGYDTGNLMSASSEVIAALLARLEDANASVVAFCAPVAVQYAREMGFPDGHLHPTHYDILEKAGARMDSFTRADLAQIKERGGMTGDWTCAGCGIAGPDTDRRCDCATAVVVRGKEGEWKTGPTCEEMRSRAAPSPDVLALVEALALPEVRALVEVLEKSEIMLRLRGNNAMADKARAALAASDKTRTS